MKKLFSILFSLFLYTTVSFADDRVALMYNIIPDDDSKNNSIVDSRIQKKLGFKLFRAQGAVYCNSQEISIIDERFEIDLNGLTGKQELKFTNDQNEEAIFTYYVADENGLVKDYMLENEQAYVKTVENAKVVYKEKHIGTGNGKGAKRIDPVTDVEMDENSYMEMDTVQIGGVTSSNRLTSAKLGKGAKLVIKERLMTDGDETAKSDFKVEMNGDDSSIDLISRSVARGNSYQEFVSTINGNCRCTGHSECDAIISENGRVNAVPGLYAANIDASLIHEAAIGKIAGEQITKLCTLGLTEEEAERKIIDGFLK